MTETNWAGYAYPPMLRDRIRVAKTWDMSYRENRWALRKMQLRYWLWWKWAPIPIILVFGSIGIAAGYFAASWIGPLL